MPSEFSFDVVSEVDMNLVSESIQVALKEIVNRFDFKDANASIDLNAKDKKLTIAAKGVGQSPRPIEPEGAVGGMSALVWHDVAVCCEPTPTPCSAD